MAGIGMMEGAYFVGRVELLNWLNELLRLDYTKVEQTCSGAAHCQIMDAIYPGQVPLSKVNFNAKHEYEYVKNFKVLQNTFDKQGIDKAIDVAKLVKGKYQDNLEFLQWIKRYFDLHYSGTVEEYSAIAIERRKGAYAADKGATGGSAPAPSKKVEVTRPKPTTTAAPKVTTAAKGTPPAKTKPTTTGSATKAPSSSASSEDSGKVAELTQQIAEYKVTIDGLEKERDFYFGKLREIEILCQSGDQESDLVKNILKILYATDDTAEPAQEEEATEEAAPVEEEEETY